MKQEALIYARMPFALVSYLRSPRIADPEQEIRVPLARRETRFLETLRRTIFADPAHPYPRLCQFAGCTWSARAASVRREGLEPALEAIRREGVYLAHDEFKGCAPIVRAGQHVPASAASWRNPLVSGASKPRRLAPNAHQQSDAHFQVGEPLRVILYLALDVQMKGDRHHPAVRLPL
jgi:hypothetical protein